jgi:hypothetical protein
MQLTDKLTIPSHVMARHVENETVILNLENGTYYGLDAVGARIWQLVAEGKTLEQVADAMVDEYEVERGALEQDIVELADKLIAQGLLQA